MLQWLSIFPVTGNWLHFQKHRKTSRESRWIRDFPRDRIMRTNPLESSLKNVFFFFPLLPFGTIQLSIPSRPIFEFFIDIILAALHRETSPWKWLGRRAGLTNEFRRAVVPGRLRFEVLSLAGNQPGWQMFAETSTSLSFFLRFFRGQTRSVPPPPSLTFVVYVLRTGKTSAPGREKR